MRNNATNTIDNLPTEVNAMWKMVRKTREETIKLMKSFFIECAEADKEMER